MTCASGVPPHGCGRRDAPEPAPWRRTIALRASGVTSAEGARVESRTERRWRLNACKAKSSSCVEQRPCYRVGPSDGRSSERGGSRSGSALVDAPGCLAGGEGPAVSFFNRDLENIPDDELVEAATHGLWSALADEAVGRARLAELSAEFTRRGLRGLPAIKERALADVWSAVERLVHSEPFASQPKMRKLLQLIVAHSLDTGDPIKQEVLGVAHYGDTAFSPQALAAEVARLRRLLIEYYGRAGLSDPLRIRIPKGRYLAVIQQMTGSARPAWLEADDQRATHRDPRPLNALRGLALFPTFSPDGQRVAFAWNRGRGLRFGLYAQAGEATPPIALTSTRVAADVCPAWSPDGRRLAFLRYGLIGGRVMVADLLPTGGLGPARRVADVSRFRTEMIGRHLAWAAGGQELFVSTVPQGATAYAICRVRLDGSRPESLTHPPAGTLGDGDPAPTPDGRGLAFVRTDAVGIKDVCLMEFGSGRVIRLTSDGKHVHGIAWRPDGRHLIVSSAHSRHADGPGSTSAGDRTCETKGTTN